MGRKGIDAAHRRRRFWHSQFLVDLEKIARGGDVVTTTDGGTPCVAVRTDHLLALVEWLREFDRRDGERTISRSIARNRRQSR